MATARRHLQDAKGRQGPRARRAGFSLVELILALGVLAIARAVLVTNDFNFTNPNELRPLNEAAAFQANPNLLLYPGDPNGGPTTRGFLVLGRSLGTLRQVVIVSYQKCDITNTVAAKLVTVDTRDATATLDDPLGNAVDTFLVWASSSEPKIITVRMRRPDPDSEWVLDRPIENIAGEKAFVIVENPSNPMAKNPVMAVLVAEIALRQ